MRRKARIGGFPRCCGGPAGRAALRVCPFPGGVRSLANDREGAGKKSLPSQFNKGGYKYTFMIYSAGIDTLFMGFYLERFLLTPEDWESLAYAKENAKSSIFKSSGSLITFKGQDLTMRASGQNPYTYVLQNNDCTIKLAQKVVRNAYPEVYVELRS